MTRLRSVTLLRFVIASALVVSSWLAVTQNGQPLGTARAADRFPHALHKGLFPTCKACHTISENRSQIYAVTESDCANCHDGSPLPRVGWSPPPPKPTNLVFEHNFHVNDVGAACADCHQAPGTDNRMDVVRPEPERCLPCHQAPGHLAEEAACATCHVPLTQAASLTAEEIASFPMPDSHLDAEFIRQHGEMATAKPERCATCHARELCETCHIDAERVPQIQALGRDPRVAQLVAAREPQWPKPPSHDDPEWVRKHGAAARTSIQNCAHCHGQEGCRRCHAGVAPAEIGELPVARPNGPRGVDMPNARPPGHGPAFLLEHRAAAASDNPRCATCHSPDYCASCHNAPAAPGFHERNYIFRHAADAWSRDIDCASCHSPEVFCRSCHEQTGLSTRDPRSASFHNAQPFWLLNHGQAARQGIESCQSCHQQKDCLRCHSAKTGWRINPHGPDFKADRLGDRSLLMCSRCHFSDPRTH